MLPERLRLQVEAMADADVGLCHCGWRMVDEAGTVIGSSGGGDHSAETPQYAKLLRDVMLPTITSVMVRKDVFQDVGGFDSTMRI